MHVKQLYAEVTASIIKDLEAGVASWVKPWKNGNGGGIMPVNAATNRAYNGVNIPILWHAQQTCGYPAPQWMTYKQAQAAGAQVRGGEKSTHIVYTKKLTVTSELNDEDKQIAMLRVYSVFNVSQIDGLQTAPVKEILNSQPADGAMRFVDAIKADIRVGGDRAAYIPSHDFITLPPEQAFTGREHYLATALHELTHWSGAKHRLDRDLNNRFGTKAYAAEELVAELGAAFLCAHLGIQGELKHAEYIATWITLLREDDRAIFTASSKASQAADYLRAFSEPMVESGTG